jgi:hypothetical protein
VPPDPLYKKIAAGAESSGEAVAAGPK